MPERAAPPVAAVRETMRRPSVGVVVLLAAFLLVAFLDDPTGYLGTDTGAKVATVKTMSDRGTWVPDVGYWAAEWDADARYHGLIYTYRFGDIYVATTSLPMVLAAKPLWDLGGYRAALLLPMLGGVGAALAARALARQCGGRGTAAFYLVGLASPALIYSVDLWEHAIGLGLMLWAVVFLHRVLDGTWRWAAAAGVALGAAFSMRTEALVYFAACSTVTCGALALRREWRRAILAGLAASGGFALAFAANQVLEQVVIGRTLRSGRAAGFASQVGSGVGLRLKESFLTALSPFPSYDPELIALAVALAAALVVMAAWGADRTRARAVGALAGVAVGIYLLRFVYGVGFVPGALAAAPVAAVGLVWPWRQARAREAALLALVPLPVVFAFQLAGGAVPQWGGRYFLTTTVALVAVGSLGLVQLRAVPRAAFVACSVAVTLFGVAWMGVRTHGVASAGAALDARPEPVLVSPDGFTPREFAGTYGQKRWLTVSVRADLPGAVEVVGRSGARQFGLVAQCPADDAVPPEFPGWHVERSDRVEFLPTCHLRVTTYRAS